MAIRIGTIINVVDTWNIYNKKLSSYKQEKHAAQVWEDAKQEKYWQDVIDQTMLEMEQFKNTILPDPVPSEESPYLAKGWQEAEADLLNKLRNSTSTKQETGTKLDTNA